MKNLIPVILLVCILLFVQFSWTACNSARKISSNYPQHAIATIIGIQPNTTLSGTILFEELEGGKVKMNLEITVPSKANQSVAVHIHEHGACGEMATQAGGHWNPANTNHGKWGSSSYHAGDIGNVILDSDGKGTLQLESDLWSLRGETKTNILNKSVIVHSGVDDYTSQPACNSGERIGCGLISIRMKD